MTEFTDTVEDPWAWLQQVNSDDRQRLLAERVTVVLLTRDDAELTRTTAALDGSSISPDHSVEIDETTLSAELASLGGESADGWLWLLRAGAEPVPTCLEAQLRTALGEPRADLVGPLLIQPRRRGHGVLIEEFGQTLTTAGRPATLAENGEPYQGQLETTPVLGANLDGLLIRRSAASELGVVAELPVSLAGLDLGWRATLAGLRVVAEPKAQLLPAPVERDEIEERRWGLALAAIHSSRGSLATRLRLILGSLASALAFVLGKDPARAGAELGGLARWLRGGRGTLALRAAMARSQPVAGARQTAAALRPGLRQATSAAADGVAGRVSDWVSTFTDREQRVNLDELTGDDFASQAASARRISPLVLGGLLVTVLALVAGRSMFGFGNVVAAQLLPAQDGWGHLVDDYLRPIAGQPAVAAPAWLGLTALAALVTGGSVDLLLAAVFLLCVPLSWLAAYRLLRQVLTGSRGPLVGGFLYALAPALVGGLNRGMFGVAVWTTLLPMLGYLVLEWSRGARHPWRQAGATGLLLLLTTSLVPLTWPVAAVIAVIAAVRAKSLRTALQLLMAIASPALLFLGPQASTVLRYPGRLLAGTDPALAPLAAPDTWLLPFGVTPGGGTPPLWLAIPVLAVAWLTALAGSIRVRTAGWALGAAVGALAVAVGLSYLLVEVSPGVVARPAVQPWLVVMIGGLTLAAAIGLDGLGSELTGRSLGLAHFGSLALTVVLAAASALAVGWWAWEGQTGLVRHQVGALPPFVRNAQVDATPGRTLALAMRSGEVTWALLEDDLPRLGDAERGLAAGGAPWASELAGDVADRLVSGSADDELVPDLRLLGVSHVWATGFDAGARTAISNTPGLGTGTGDDAGATWPVPDSARAVIVDGATVTATGDGADVASGTAARSLQLAEPADPRWTAQVGGQPLTPASAADQRQSFQLGAASGRLQLELAQGSLWWVWSQLAGLVMLVLLALPGLTTGAGAAPRRGMRVQR